MHRAIPFSALLSNSTIYHWSQLAGGFFSGRVTAIGCYLRPQKGQRMIDIGCGPGHIVNTLPEGVIYDGFDIDENYIAFANRRFGSRGRFHCRLFDDDAAIEFGPADIVMMNGVLHHMDDESVRRIASSISKALKPGGVLFALDGVYAPGQGAIAKWLLDKDRGGHVRTEQGYRALLSKHFADCRFHIRHDLTRVPYSVVVSVCRKPEDNGRILT